MLSRRSSSAIPRTRSVASAPGATECWGPAPCCVLGVHIMGATASRTSSTPTVSSPARSTRTRTRTSRRRRMLSGGSRRLRRSSRWVSRRRGAHSSASARPLAVPRRPRCWSGPSCRWLRRPRGCSLGCWLLPAKGSSQTTRRGGCSGPSTHRRRTADATGRGCSRSGTRPTSCWTCSQRGRCEWPTTARPSASARSFCVC
mmetsp:Transcript_108091/g.345240  ORF Transcript_108091/g.345240 Transcript_108091/m.345240 type:complete len:201 (-) Transcript_108091:1770-2372(-)